MTRAPNDPEHQKPIEQILLVLLFVILAILFALVVSHNLDPSPETLRDAHTES